MNIDNPYDDEYLDKIWAYVYRKKDWNRISHL